MDDSPVYTGQLVILFEFTKLVGSCWDWLASAPMKEAIITPAQIFNAEEADSLAVAFANESELYSSSFFATYEEVMSTKGL